MGGVNTRDVKIISFWYFSQIRYYKKSRRFLLLPALFIYDILIAPVLLYKIRQFNPDVIYSNAAAENLGIWFAQKLGVKHISHIREFMDLDFGANFIGGAKARASFLLKSDGLIFVSHAVQHHVMLGDGQSNNQRVIYNGINIPDKEPKDVDIPNIINIGIVGILDPAKGQHLALELLSKLKADGIRTVLHIWGDKEGGYKDFLLRKICDLKLTSNVVMHGFEKDQDRIYHDMHVLLMYSRAEGFGRVTVEAMARGIPVLGYDNAGTSEIVEHCVSGFLFKHQDEAVYFFKKMFSNAQNYNHLRKAAYQRTKTYFNKADYAENVYQFVKEIVQK